MRKIILATFAAGVAACAAIAAPDFDTSSLNDGERERLEKALENRVPGDPVSCVNTRDLRGNEGFGTDIIVFKGRRSASDVYVNRPPAGCGNFDRSTALVVRTTTTRLCKGDIVQLYDPSLGNQYGGCGLGEFVPYRRVDRGG